MVISSTVIYNSTLQLVAVKIANRKVFVFFSLWCLGSVVLARLRSDLP